MNTHSEYHVTNTVNHHDSSLNQSMTALINPDNNGEWAVRYVWIQHRDNQQFLANYFKNGNNMNINVRAMTSHLKNDWSFHNRIFDLSAQNGDLKWRVKVLNTVSNSIDYIEIWRNKQLINNYFNDHDQESTLPDGTVWTTASKKNLSKEVFNSGFITRSWIPPVNISSQQALECYQKFVLKFEQNDNCIINTRVSSTFYS